MTDQSSKDKGKGKNKSNDWDRESLSLSEYHGPSSNCCIPRYASPVPFIDVDLTTPNMVYTENQNYRHDGQVRTPTWSVPDPSVTRSCSGTSGWTGQSDAGVSSWDNQSVSSAQESIFSDQSQATVMTTPSRTSQFNVNMQISQQLPPRQRYQLPCEIYGCSEVFAGDEYSAWIDHTTAHLRGSFPSRLRCWFCDDFGPFEAKKTSSGDRALNFEMRMMHIREHIISGEFIPAHRSVDGFIIEHLRRQGATDEQGYHDMLRPSRVPQAQPSCSGHHHSHRHSQHQPHNHHNLQPVVEEAGPSSSSGSRERRSEKKSSDRKREHREDSHYKK